MNDIDFNVQESKEQQVARTNDASTNKAFDEVYSSLYKPEKFATKPEASESTAVQGKDLEKHGVKEREGDYGSGSKEREYPGGVKVSRHADGSFAEISVPGGKHSVDKNGDEVFKDKNGKEVARVTPRGEVTINTPDGQFKEGKSGDVHPPKEQAPKSGDAGPRTQASSDAVAKFSADLEESKRAAEDRYKAVTQSAAYKRGAEIYPGKAPGTDDGPQSSYDRGFDKYSAESKLGASADKKITVNTDDPLGKAGDAPKGSLENLDKYQAKKDITDSEADLKKHNIQWSQTLDDNGVTQTRVEYPNGVKVTQGEAVTKIGADGKTVTTSSSSVEFPEGSTRRPDGTVVDKSGNPLAKENKDGSTTIYGKDGNYTQTREGKVHFEPKNRK